MQKPGHTKFWSENFKGRGNLVDLGVDGRVIVKSLEKFNVYWIKRNGGLL
jgi:hypothetical protein